LKICISKNSTKNHTLCSIFMLNISIQKLSWKESEILHSIEDLELFSRVSLFQTGQLLKRDMDGKLMHIQDKLGIMLWLISIMNVLQCHSLEKDKNLMLLNGLDLNNLEKVYLPDFSIMKFQILCGTDTMVI
jgi:hypothetical protein